MQRSLVKPLKTIYCHSNLQLASPLALVYASVALANNNECTLIVKYMFCFTLKATRPVQAAGRRCYEMFISPERASFALKPGSELFNLC